MNAFLRKEIRLLLPTFIGALVLAFSPLGISDTGYSTFRSAIIMILPVILTPALVLMMALNSFGSEISAGTFSNLLAQPISRRRIWWTKTSLLAVTFFLVWAVWWLSFINNKNLPMDAREVRETFLATILISAVFFSGGLWTVLLLRQVAAAFWFTILIPAAMALFAVTQTREESEVIAVALMSILGVYSIAGFIFARWLFLRAQDVQWTGGVIALPESLSRANRKNGSLIGQTWRPMAALFAKELQLHQSQLVMAGILALLHLPVVLARKFGGDFARQPVTEMVLSGFWTLWFAMPLLIGCAAVAEERKLGTLESQLCLPVRRRTQFWIKLSSALVLSVALGLLMPFLFEGKGIFPEMEIKAVSELAKNFAGDPFVRDLVNVLRLISQLLPVLVPLGIIAVIATVSFYASTVSRNTLQSLAPAILGIFTAFFFLIGANDVEKLSHYPLWRGWLIFIIGVPVLTSMLLGLMYWNFKRVWVDWKVWQRNALVFFAALAFVVVTTTAIYHRVWEYLTPLEPAHGIARLEKSAEYKIESMGMRTAIHLADGRAWSAWMTFGAPSFSWIFLGDWQPSSKSGELWNGTDWVSVASSYFDDVGVRKDGSLWVSEEPRKRTEFGKSSLPQRPLIRFGEDNHWKSVSSYSRRIFLLKTDGTLWSWGAEPTDGNKDWPGLRPFEPKRLGTNSDWVEIYQTEYRTAFRKTNGETWIYPQLSSKGTNNLQLNNEITVERAEHLDGLTSTTSVSLRRVDTFQVSVGNDGTFSITSGLERSGIHINRVNKNILLSKHSDWLAVAGEGESVVTLKADGTLWRWNFKGNPIANPSSASAVRLGKHSDWIAIADQFGGVTSLASDGSLWFWRFNDPHYSPSPVSGMPPLLAASRRPEKIGNIFD